MAAMDTMACIGFGGWKGFEVPSGRSYEAAARCVRMRSFSVDREGCSSSGELSSGAMGAGRFALLSRDGERTRNSVSSAVNDGALGRVGTGNLSSGGNGTKVGYGDHELEQYRVMSSGAYPQNSQHGLPQTCHTRSSLSRQQGASLQVGLRPFKSPLALCQCGSRPALRCGNAGRESQPGFSSISFRSQGRSRNTANLRRLARAIKISRESTLDKNGEQKEEDDTDLCPVECVREFTSQREFDQILQYAKQHNALVVVDFFKTACGSCRYIETGFQKLCKGSGNTENIVIFLKHNVMDEYEEQSEVAENYKIKVVPLFHFYKDAKLVESFPTREKTKILEAICRHTGLHPEDVSIPKGG